MNPLHDACEDLDFPAIAELLRQGQDPNSLNDTGQPALHVLATFLGERIDDLSRDADSPAITDTLALGERALSQLVAAGCDVAATDRGGDTVLHVIAEYYQHQVVALLLALGVPIEARGEDDDTAFIRAAKTHSRSAPATVSNIEALARAGADINAVNDFGDNALHFAACHGETPTIDALCSLGINVNQRDRNGRTPLDWASSNGHVNSVRSLLQSGADPNLANRQGRTPLMAAALHGSAVCTRALLDAGADPRVADHNGATALSLTEPLVGSGVATRLIQQLCSTRSGGGGVVTTQTLANESGEPVIEVRLASPNGGVCSRVACDRFDAVYEILKQRFDTFAG